MELSLDLIKRIIKEQEDEINSIISSDIIEREYIDVLSRYLIAPNIVAILGVRRSGKSVLSMLLKNSLNMKAGYINFDDERLLGLKSQDLTKVEQAFYELYGDVELLIFDEIQNTEGWELFLNRLRRTKKIIITGSNSNFLNGDLATNLTGRYIEALIFPFSFRELTGLKIDENTVLTTKEISEIRNFLEIYEKGSSFPEFRVFGKRIVKQIFEDIVTKDCIRRHKIREEKTFRDIAFYLISNSSGYFTYSKLKNIYKIGDVHTIRNYISYLESAFLIFILKKFSHKLKNQDMSPKKVYPVDHGFINFLAFRISENKGKIYETIVAIDLLRRKVLEEEDYELYYYKDRYGYEVDFVIKRQEEIIQLIQVTVDINMQVNEREIRSLLIASKELRCQNLIVITSEKEGEDYAEWKGIKGKIKFIPLWKWLLII